VKVLSSVFPDARITGIDPDEKAIDEALKDFGDEKISFLTMGAEKLDFPDGSFDLAAISNALHHLPDRESVIGEMKRVVKPDGYLLISELYSDNLNPAQEVQKLFHHTRSKVDQLLGIYHHETWKRGEIIDMVNGFGLRIVGEFDFEKKGVSAENKPELEHWIAKLQQIIERTNHLPEYEYLLPILNEFREKIREYGFQPATNVVLICRK